MNIGVGIKLVRHKLGLNQEEFCHRIGLSQGFYSGLESGLHNPSMRTLKKITNALKLPIIVFVWFGTDKNDIPKSKRHLYDQLKPTIDSLMQEIIPKK